MSLHALLFAIMITPCQAGTAPARDDDAIRHSTAVTLNYCRAAFDRIQRYPTASVLTEEQEKILNNLDLNSIADQEVVKLYTAVLVEISEQRLVDRERQVVQEHYHTALGSALTADAFDFGTELAAQHYVSAIRTGARSWWDYRAAGTARDTDVFKVDQKRLMAFTEKSGQFLDTFWKLARDRKIPDRWLVRNQDLNRLDAAMREPDLDVRLRVLKRMEDFMCCYPPYWYYVGRTQQSLGDLESAKATYAKLEAIGRGHFRKDDMLAAGLANSAVIRDFLHEPCAVETAQRALGYSTDVWEGNLMCASVLARRGRTGEAEDAILRNLDVNLERDQSLTSLVSLYIATRDTVKLRARLAIPAVVCRMPMAMLFRAAAVLGPRRVPTAVLAYWSSSIAARYDFNFGPDDFVLVTAPQWGLQASEMSLGCRQRAFRQSTIALLAGKSEVRFAGIGDLGHPFYATSSPPPAVLVIRFPQTPIVCLKLDPGEQLPAGSPGFPMSELFSSISFSGSHQNLMLTSVEIGTTGFPVAARLAGRAGRYDEADEPIPAPARIEQPLAGQPKATPAPGPDGTISSSGSTPPKPEHPPVPTPPKPGPAVTGDLSRSSLAAGPPITGPLIPDVSGTKGTAAQPVQLDGPKLFP